MSKVRFTFQLDIHHERKLFKTFKLPVGNTIIGRDDDNDIVLPAPDVSGEHARIECTETQCFIVDLESSNGTFVDQRRIPPNQSIRITTNSRIAIRTYRMVIRVINVERPEEEKPAPDRPESVTDEKIQEEKETAGGGDDLPPPPDQHRPENEAPEEPYEPPPGLERESRRLINFLPEIYRKSPFIVKLLGLTEATLLPIEWTADNFDLFLSPNTSPPDFLPWLAAWYDVIFDESWPIAKRRLFLREAYQLFALRGTKQGLTRLLTIYTDVEPTIIDMNDVGSPLYAQHQTYLEQHPVRFVVHLPIARDVYNHYLLEHLINQHKPAHTNYFIEYQTS